MENLIISFQSMKSEMVELRSENRRINEKLDSHNTTIISLSEELKSFKKEMCIFPKWRRRIYSILEKMLNKIDLIDNSNSNDYYTSNTLINNENDFENILDNNTILQETLFKTEIIDEIEDNSTLNENDDYNNNLSNMTDTMINTENVLNDVENNSITNEITIKTELVNQNNENIEGNLEKESNFIDEEDNSMNFINESEYQGSIESSNPQTSNLSTVKEHINDKRFTQSSSLNSHLKIHTGEKLFKCNICSKKFRHSTSLKEHLRLHTGEKSFECKQCSKRFAQYAGLNQHLRTHTGEKPYECKQCSKRYAQYAGLYIHLKTHTGK